jgi:hypothetical protein
VHEDDNKKSKYDIQKYFVFRYKNKIIYHTTKYKRADHEKIHGKEYKNVLDLNLREKG